MLLGSLFPAPDGIKWVGVATVIAAPVIVYEILRWLPRVHPVIFFVMPLFAVIASSALLIPPTSAYGTDKLLTFATLTLASALAASLLRDSGTVVTFTWVWIVAAAALSIQAVVGYVGGVRAGGFDDSPIWLARALATAALMVVWHWWHNRTRPIRMVLLLALIIAGIFTTGSRGPLLGFVIGAVLLAIGGQKRFQFKRVAMLVVAGIAAVAALQLLPIFSASRLTGGGTTQESDGLRTLFWQISQPILEAKPFGVGFGNWSFYAHAPAGALWPHNIFLELATEAGIPIAIFFLAMVCLVFVLLLRTARKSQTALLTLAMLAAETLAVCVSGDLNARTFFFLLTLGFLVGVGHLRVEPDETTLPHRSDHSLTRVRRTVQ